jgi:hypothetical protein
MDEDEKAFGPKQFPTLRKFPSESGSRARHDKNERCLREHLTNEGLPISPIAREMALVEASSPERRQSITWIADRDKRTDLAQNAGKVLLSINNAALGRERAKIEHWGTTVRSYYVGAARRRVTRTIIPQQSSYDQCGRQCGIDREGQKQGSTYRPFQDLEAERDEDDQRKTNKDSERFETLASPPILRATHFFGH